MADIQQFIDEFNGAEGIGDTGANRGECVGLVEAWLDSNGLPHIWGNACDLANNADRDIYDVIPNTDDYVPMPGEIGVLPVGWGGSPVGHTFVVAPGTNVRTLVAFEQNNRINNRDGVANEDGRCRINSTIDWPEGLVFIRPKVFNPAPVQPAPVPELAPVEPTPEPAVETPASEPEPAQLPQEPASPVPTDTEPLPAEPVNDQPPTQVPPVNNESDTTMQTEPVPALKPGYKTTEFYVTLTASLLPLLNIVLGSHVTADQAAVFMNTMASSIAALVAVVTYVRGRLSLKRAE